jgi:hypothetical protein
MKKRLHASGRRWLLPEAHAMNERLKRVLFGTALTAVLALAFVAYLRPSFVFDLANRIILCF